MFNITRKGKERLCSPQSVTFQKILKKKTTIKQTLLTQQENTIRKQHTNMYVKLIGYIKRCSYYLALHPERI